jgi:hypothetical protein
MASIVLGMLRRDSIASQAVAVMWTEDSRAKPSPRLWESVRFIAIPETVAMCTHRVPRPVPGASVVEPTCNLCPSRPICCTQLAARQVLALPGLQGLAFLGRHSRMQCEDVFNREHERVRRVSGRGHGIRGRGLQQAGSLSPTLMTTVQRAQAGVRSRSVARHACARYGSGRLWLGSRTTNCRLPASCSTSPTKPATTGPSPRNSTSARTESPLPRFRTGLACCSRVWSTPTRTCSGTRRTAPFWISGFGKQGLRAWGRPSGSCGAAWDAQGSEVLIKRAKGFLSTGDLSQSRVQLLQTASHGHRVDLLGITLHSRALS